MENFHAWLCTYLEIKDFAVFFLDSAGVAYSPVKMCAVCCLYSSMLSLFSLTGVGFVADNTELLEAISHLPTAW